MAGVESIDAIRTAWRAAHLTPLWESPTAHKPPPAPERAHLWPWLVLRPLIADAIDVQSPAAIERRVLQLVNPASRGAHDEGTTRNLTAAIQILMPGETARAAAPRRSSTARTARWRSAISSSPRPGPGTSMSIAAPAR
jgi:gentisate 1,2-dioxygenase